jgi:hypothetical protein
MVINLVAMHVDKFISLFGKWNSKDKVEKERWLEEYEIVPNIIEIWKKCYGRKIPQSNTKQVYEVRCILYEL